MSGGIQKRRMLINATMSVMQVVVTGVVLFILYRFLLNTIGIEQLGIWSVVLATTSVANIANLGLSASVVKFVAKYLARDEEKTAANVIQTSAISISVFVGLVLLVAYPFATWFLGLVIPVNNLNDALSILPYALASLWIMVIASVFQAGLDGYQRIDLRSMLFMAGAIFHLLLSILLVPAHGLQGLAFAQVAKSFVMLIGIWVVLKRHLPLLPTVPYKWNRELFREMVSYGLNFQAISISQMLYDPITKALLTRFGGLAMVGFYEMANRMLMQFRMLLVSANQVLVPVIADLQEKNPGLIQKVYKDSYNLMLYLALPGYAVIIAFIPLISEIWIGRYEAIFVIFSILLAVNLFINTLSVPAYFSCLGIGKLKWITLGHIATAIMNAALGITIGNILGGIGVVIAWVVSSMAGTAIIFISYHYMQKIPLKKLLPRDSVWLAAACLASAGFALLIYHKINHVLGVSTIGGVLLLVFALVTFIPFWYHPMRKRLTGWVYNELLKGRKKEGE